MQEFIPSALYAWSLSMCLFLPTLRIKTATPASPMLILGVAQEGRKRCGSNGCYRWWIGCESARLTIFLRLRFSASLPQVKWFIFDMLCNRSWGARLGKHHAPCCIPVRQWVAVCIYHLVIGNNSYLARLQTFNLGISTSCTLVMAMEGHLLRWW